MATTVDDAGQPTLTALAARVEAANDPLSRLTEIRVLRDVLAAAEADAAGEARARQATWAEIGAGLGISKQAAQKRYGDRRQSSPTGAEPMAPEGPSPGVAKPRRGTAGWDVTTPGGRTLLRVRRTPRR